LVFCTKKNLATLIRILQLWGSLSTKEKTQSRAHLHFFFAIVVAIFGIFVGLSPFRSGGLVALAALTTASAAAAATAAVVTATVFRAAAVTCWGNKGHIVLLDTAK
jgi:hypothetical protein